MEQKQSSHSQDTSDRLFFKLIQKSGTNGTYQLILLILWSIIGFLNGGIVLILPFLFYQQPYNCQNLQIKQSCLQHVCNLPSINRLQFIPKQQLLTLAGKYGDYRCPNEQYYLNLIQAIMYSSQVIGYLVLALFGNLLKRKNFLLILLFISFCGYFVTIFSVSIQMAGVGLFLVSIGVVAGFNICFLFISETVKEQQRVKQSVLIQFFYGLGAVCNVGTYYWLKNWVFVFIFFYMIPTLVLLVCVSWLVKHTPIDLVTKSTPEYALQTLIRIAQVNNVQTFITIQQIKQTVSLHQIAAFQSQKSHYHVIDLFKYGSLRWTTILLVLVLCAISIQFYVPVLMVATFELGLYINALILGLSQLLAYPLCYFLISRVPRKLQACISFGVISICSFILIFIWSPFSSQNKKQVGFTVGTFIVMFTMRFFTTLQFSLFYVYYNQLYPTQVRASGVGFVSMIGGLVVMVNPFLVSGLTQKSVHVMIVILIVSIVALLSSCFLPQTLNAPVEDVIEQLKQIMTIKNSPPLPSSEYFGSESQKQMQNIEDGVSIVIATKYNSKQETKNKTKDKQDDKQETISTKSRKIQEKTASSVQKIVGDKSQ